MFERKILFHPAYDKRNADPKKNYGIHNMSITFVLIGPKGAVQWAISTGWYVKSAREHLKNFPLSWEERTMKKIWGTDLGYHAHDPQYEDQYSRDDCHLLGGKCYYDGSSLNAELLEEGFLEKGEDYVWEKLEGYYNHTFENGPWPLEAESAIQNLAYGFNR